MIELQLAILFFLACWLVPSVLYIKYLHNSWVGWVYLFLYPPAVVGFILHKSGLLPWS